MSGAPRDRLVLIGGIAAAAVIALAFGLTIVPTLLTNPPGNPGGCGTCGTPPFAIGDAAGPTHCTGNDTPTVGCLAAGDYVYRVTIETSQSVSFGQVYLRVLNFTGANFSSTARGGFTVTDQKGQSVAAFILPGGGPLSMTAPSQWVFLGGSSGVSSSTPFTVFYSLTVDLGSVNPAGSGCSLMALLTGSQAGHTSSIELP